MNKHKMTLDEAIQHCEITAKSNEKLAECYYNKDPGKNQKSGDACQECAVKYRQFAGWLKELKQYREGTLPANDWIPVSERLPEDNGWYQCTVILNDLPRTMELFYKNGKWLDNRRINMFDTYDIFGYGNTKEKHKLSYQELISEFEWSQVVIAWKPLSQPYIAESEG